MLLATMPMVIALVILVTGVVLVVRGVIELRRSARLARTGQAVAINGTSGAGVATVVVGAVLIGTVIAFLLFIVMAVGSIADN